MNGSALAENFVEHEELPGLYTNAVRIGLCSGNTGEGATITIEGAERSAPSKR
jgi:hypothetical protein